MHRVILDAALVVGLPVFAQAQVTCTATGKERWTVKTLPPRTSGAPHVITPADFVALSPPATAMSGQKAAKMLETRYPDAVSAARREGHRNVPLGTRD